MEIYKRKVGYEDIAKSSNLIITATTLYFPFFLKQSYEDIGIYTDFENPVFEIVDLAGVWNLKNDGVGQKPCKLLNNCKLSFISTPVTFFNGGDGSIQLTITNQGTPDCPGQPIIEWSGPNNFTENKPTIKNLKAGTYSVKITDGDCNLTYANYVITQPQSLTINLSTTNSQVNDINGTCNGSATVTPIGGKSPYTYQWFSGPPNITSIPGTTNTQTNLCAGPYTVKITDDNGDVISSIFNITEPLQLSGTVKTTTNLSCNNGSDGKISVEGINGYAPTGYTYNLKGPAPSTSTIATNTTGNFTGLVVGTYTVEVVDFIGSTYNITNITLTQPTAVNATVNGTNLTCYGSANGTITATPTGGGNIAGSNTYTVYVKDGNTIITSKIVSEPNSVVFNKLKANNYTLDITDTNGCTITKNISLYQKPQLILNTLNPPTCSGPVITAQTTYSVSGVNILPPPTLPTNMNYYVDGVYAATCTLSSPSQTCQSLLTLGAGPHDITVVDINNCSATTKVNISNMPLSITYGIIDSEDNAIVNDQCAGGFTKQFIIDINGGTAPYTIAWSGDGDNSTITTSKPHCAKRYTGPYTLYTISVTVTDANGCIVTKSWSIDTQLGTITEL